MQKVRIHNRPKRKVILGAVIAASALLSAFQPASGGTLWEQDGPHAHQHEGRFYSGHRAVLRDNDDDAVKSDGLDYAGRGSSAGTLFDSPPGTNPDEPSDWDYLVLWPKDGRRLVLSSDLVDGDPSTGGNQPFVCEEDSYLFFGRFSDDRDWVEELSSVGDSTTGDASFNCWLDDPSSPGTQHRYYDVSWYHQGLRNSGQCVTYSRTDSKTLRFEAPPATVSPITGIPIPQDDGCPAEVRLVTRTKEADPQTASEYTYTSEALGYESAPLQLTVEFVGRFI